MDSYFLDEYSQCRNIVSVESHGGFSTRDFEPPGGARIAERCPANPPLL
jgi:hypothetical protein